MNSQLILRNKNIRKNRPIIPKDILYSTYENNGVFQICFKSRGCSNYLAGFCIMCDYCKCQYKNVQKRENNYVQKREYP